MYFKSCSAKRTVQVKIGFCFKIKGKAIPVTGCGGP
jgi:hypothetical protein